MKRRCRRQSVGITLMILAFCFLLPTFKTMAYNSSVEETVRQTFFDTPVLIAIAKCESNFRQYGLDGTALRGGLGGSMIGVMQIHEHYHRNRAVELGLNIDDIKGNLAYAKELFLNENTTPWNSSYECWKNSTASDPIQDFKTLNIHVPSSTNNDEIINNLTSQIEGLQKQVYLLQIKLLEKQIEILNVSIQNAQNT